MQIKIKIQSFGDVITNSSSEIYTIYNSYGLDSIKEAISNLIKAINPDIDIDEHVTIELVPCNEEFEEFYNKEFNQWCLNKSNEEILVDFPKWLKEFQKENVTDDNGIPLWDIEIKPITDLGEIISKAINNILYAFDHEEIYT